LLDALPVADGTTRIIRCQPKPHWVVDEVIRLKAHMPHDGCRKIASTFNRMHKRPESVSKSFVSKVIRNHQYAIRVKRHLIRNSLPYPCAPNAVWGIDLTGKNDVFGNTHHILGIVDHGLNRPGFGGGSLI
jgi:putative transposase